MESVKFGELCGILEKISTCTKPKKLKILNNLINSAREIDAPQSTSFYSLVRLLLPALDKDRRAYGIKEHTLAKTYIRILCLPKDSPDAKKLLKYKSPAAGSSSGDFADVAYWVLKTRCHSGCKLTVQDVNAHLDKIASLHGSSKPRGVDNELTDILLNMSAEEQKWFIRMLLKDLKLQVSQSDILNTIHPDAKELYDVCNNLQKVCEKLQDPKKHLHEIDISLFEPCRPMLSERTDIITTDKLIEKAKVPFFFVEKKHDGERFQIHIGDDSFRYFSRDGKEYTKSFGVSKRTGILTPALSKQLHPSVKTCIFDGEMMGWNKKLGCFGSKAQKFDVKYLQEVDLHQPCFCVFDVLFLNGKVLTNKPLHERIAIMRGLFTEQEGVIMMTPQRQVTSRDEVRLALNDAIDRQEEGLILKNPNSIYKPATKKGGWFKIKPEYTIGLSDELDLVIMGGYFGVNQCISHFLVGVAVPPIKDGDLPQEFHSVGRVGSGYSNEELREICDKLSPHWRPVKSAVMPHGLVWSKERPQLWIPPHHSLILQVKASEIVPSDSYKTGFTLRFPRVERVRYDKQWSECCTTTEFEQLRLSNCGKLASRHVPADLPPTSPSKRQRNKVVPVVGKDYQAADLTDATLEGTLFSGKEICVLNGSDKITKQELEKLIHAQGGIIVQQRGPDTYCVVAGKRDFRFRNIERNDVDVVTVDWILHVLEKKELSKWGPSDLWAMTLKTQSEIGLKYDRFGDSYHNPTSIEELKLTFEKVSNQDSAVNLLPSEMGDLDIEIFGALNKFAVFRSCIAHMIPPVTDDDLFSHKLMKAMFRFQGGCISELNNPKLTHVVMDAQDNQNYLLLQSLNWNRDKKFHVVSYAWIESCFTSKDLLPEADFHPKSVSHHH